MNGSMIDGIYIPEGERWEPPMTTAQVSKHFGVCRQTIDTWRKRGLPCHQPNGGKCYFFRKEVEAWFKSLSSQSSEECFNADTTPKVRPFQKRHR